MLLAWIESPLDYWSARDQLAAWLGGKTIAGGLIGGWIGVEVAKKRVGVSHSTGDLFVFPLIAGIAIGRIGCFLTGLPDKTYGVHTSLPWSVDFGDGPRHPTQLYEIAFLLLLGIALFIRTRKPYANGELFRLFLGGYLAWRFAVEFIKPRYTYPYLGVSAIQIASLMGALICALQLRMLHGGHGRKGEFNGMEAGLER
jgi:prolipoprotein diacylglyceryltransferase